jgi:hypothetical protein
MKNQHRSGMMTRSAFVTSRALDFFSEAELTRQFGHGRELWPLVVVKELVDNSLDGCEATETAPEITIALELDAITLVEARSRGKNGYKQSSRNLFNFTPIHRLLTPVPANVTGN